MPHQDVDGTISCQINYFMDNNNAANIFHVRATGPITLTLLDALNLIIQDWLTTSWSPLTSNDWTANQLILTGLNSLFDPRKSYAYSPPITGELLGGSMPANVTLAVKEDVGRRGRGIAGRWFWVGLVEEQVVGNEVSSATTASILEALNLLNTTIASHAGFEGIAVPHLQVGGDHPNPATSDVITGFIITDNSIDTQKDRLPFHKKRGKKKTLPVIP